MNLEPSSPPPQFEGYDVPEPPEAVPVEATVEATAEVVIEPPVPPLEFPQKGDLDNLDLLHHYEEVATIDESDASHADKAKAWLGFARQWADEKAYAAHAQRRAMQWLKASRIAKEWDDALAKLVRQLDGGKLSDEAMREKVDAFVVEAPPWWQQERDVPAQLMARLEPEQVDPVPPAPPPVPPPPPFSPTPASSTSPRVTESSVIDFCANETQAMSDRFVRQKVLALPLANAQLVERGELDVDGTTIVHHLRAAKGATQLEGMFRSYFPLARFDTVLAETRVKDGWFEAENLAFLQVEAAMQNDFDRYSLACTDYIVIGKVDGFSGRWSEQEIEDPRSGQKVRVPLLDANVEGEVVIFKRQGAGFERLARLQAKSGGALGFASKFSGKLAQTGLDPTGVAENVDELGRSPGLPYVSLRPTSDCKIPSAEVGVAGLSCPADPESAPELPGPPGLGEASKQSCTDFEIVRTHAGAAICGIRTSGELFALSVQKSARSVEGWRLFAPLEPPDRVEGLPLITLGEAEGLSRGMGFHAVTGTGADVRRLGYAKVKRVGRADAAGSQASSALAWRFGEAPPGTRMEEYPQIGFTIAVGPQVFGPTLRNANVTTGVNAFTSELTTTHAARGFVGPELEVGYDLTRYTFNELWLRTRLSYLVAPVAGHRMSTLNIQVGPEARLMTYRRGYWFGSLVGNVSAAYLRTYVDRPESSLFGQIASGSDAVGGFELRTGLDTMINADLYLRFSLGWLQNFGRLEYEKDDEVLFNRRDRLSGMTISLTIAYTL